jgi:hypothetical protein
MDERAVSVPVNYSQAIIITTILLAGLMLATADEVRSQRDRTIQSEFEVLSNRIAADLSAADRLASTTESTNQDVVEVTTSLPPTVAGAGYTAEISSTPVGSGYRVTVSLDASRGDSDITYHLKTRTEVLDSTIGGGEYTITYVDTDADGVPDALEVQGG